MVLLFNKTYLHVLRFLKDTLVALSVLHASSAQATCSSSSEIFGFLAKRISHRLYQMSCDLPFFVSIG